MGRYRVHVVPRTGRFRPLLTVLVEASSRDEALRIAEIRCPGSKGVRAEDVQRPQPRLPELRLVVPPAAESVSWSDCGAAVHA
jgi:hypothetical protein